MSQRLAGRVALVTGAGRGIGAGIALRLGTEGATVIVHYGTSEEGAKRVATQITEQGGSAHIAQADVRNPSDVERLVQWTVQECGGLDILVNNAGIDPRHAFLELTPAQWDAIVDTNLKGTFLCTQAAARSMVRAKYGRIINIGSVHGVLSQPNMTAYAASKGGIVMFTKQVALELAPHGITVNCVAPGVVEVEKYYEQFPGYDADQLGSKLPVGRVGYPHDVAGIVAFLASEEACFITGQNIIVDGGTTSQLAL